MCLHQVHFILPHLVTVHDGIFCGSFPSLLSTSMRLFTKTKALKWLVALKPKRNPVIVLLFHPTRRQQYEEAQAQIASLSDQLERARHGRDSDDGKAHFMDNSLSGMCLADELRDVLADEELVPIRDSKRPRKRPSSYLSVALAKMDQSSNAGDIPSDGAKKTRLSLPASSGEAFCTDEIAVIRDHLVELQVAGFL